MHFYTFFPSWKLLKVVLEVKTTSKEPIPYPKLRPYPSSWWRYERRCHLAGRCKTHLHAFVETPYPSHIYLITYYQWRRHVHQCALRNSCDNWSIRSLDCYKIIRTVSTPLLCVRHRAHFLEQTVRRRPFGEKNIHVRRHKRFDGELRSVQRRNIL